MINTIIGCGQAHVHRYHEVRGSRVDDGIPAFDNLAFSTLHAVHMNMIHSESIIGTGQFDALGDINVRSKLLVSVSTTHLRLGDIAQGKFTCYKSEYGLMLLTYTLLPANLGSGRTPRLVIRFVWKYRAAELGEGRTDRPQTDHISILVISAHSLLALSPQYHYRDKLTLEDISGRDLTYLNAKAGFAMEPRSSRTATTFCADRLYPPILTSCVTMHPETWPETAMSRRNDIAAMKDLL